MQPVRSNVISINQCVQRLSTMATEEMEGDTLNPHPSFEAVAWLTYHGFPDLTLLVRGGMQHFPKLRKVTCARALPYTHTNTSPCERFLLTYIINSRLAEN